MCLPIFHNIVLCGKIPYTQRNKRIKKIRRLSCWFLCLFLFVVFLPGKYWEDSEVSGSFVCVCVCVLCVIVSGCCRFLVFFDDGYAQYCWAKELHKVYYQSEYYSTSCVLSELHCAEVFNEILHKEACVSRVSSYQRISGAVF